MRKMSGNRNLGSEEMDLGKMEVIRQIPQLLSDAIAATETLQRDDTDGFETSRKLALQAVDTQCCSNHPRGDHSAPVI